MAKKQVKPKINFEKSEIFDLILLKKLDTLNKIRLIVGLIFLLMTLSIILVLVTASWISLILILFSYLLVLVLTIKLFMIKKI